MVNKNSIVYNLFIFGNGFDLAHGLPTKYIDYFYFLEVLFEYANGGLPALNKKLKLIENHGYSKESVEHLQRYFESAFGGKTCPAYLNTIIDTLSFGQEEHLNCWHSYFKKNLHHNLDNVTWIDFESEIQKLVTHLEEHSERPTVLVGILTEKIENKRFQFPNKILNLLEKCQYPGKMWKEIFQDSVNEVVLFLYHQLLQYAFCFELYLRFYVVQYCIECTPKKADPFVDRLFTECLSNSAQRINQFVLSFNYTDTIEEIYKSYDYYELIKNIHHLHGMIRSSKDLEDHMYNDEYKLATPLVLGFHNADENLDQTPSPFIWFEKFYQRMLHHTGTNVYRWLDYVNRKRASLQGKDTKMRAVFYGHSLDVTDQDLIKKVFATADLIEIYYHNEGALPSILTNLVRILGKEKLEADYTGSKLSFILAKPD